MRREEGISGAWRRGAKQHILYMQKEKMQKQYEMQKQSFASEIARLREEQPDDELQVASSSSGDLFDGIMRRAAELKRRALAE